MKWTIKALFQSTLKFNPNRRDVPLSPFIRLDKIIPFAGVGSALIQLTLKGVTQKTSSGYPVNHKVNIFFYDLDISREPKQGYLKATDSTGDYYIQPPNANKTPVRVRCTCHDHYFTWGIWNYQQGAIFGNKPRPYRRKTAPPPVGYPYRNPKHIVGLCKHVKNSIKYLQSRKIIV